MDFLLKLQVQTLISVSKAFSKIRGIVIFNEK